MAKKTKNIKFPFDKKMKKAGGLLGVIIFVLAIFVARWAGLPVDDLLFEKEKPQPVATEQAALTEGTYEVERCVDGDTILLVGGTRIRMIGANTPETVKPNSPVEPFGPEASQYTKTVVAQNGNKVRISFDGDQIDRYGRTLAMVWLGDELLNEQLIREGLAKAELQYKYSDAMKSRFRNAESAAKLERRGIWSLPENR